MHNKPVLAHKQTGFTLIELIIVIVVIGILAAVAVPKFTGVSDEARLGVQQGVLGGLKSAAATAYAINKKTVTCSMVADQMSDPTCKISSGTNITCPGIKKLDGVTDSVFTCTDGTSGPGGTGGMPTITCSPTAGC